MIELIESINWVLLSLVFLLPFTVADAGIGILFVIMALQSVGADIIFRSLTFTFGAVWLAAGLYMCAATSAALLYWCL